MNCNTAKCQAACCTFITVPYHTETFDLKVWLKLHGLTWKRDGNGGLYVKMPIACQAFDQIKKCCSQYETRPEICRVYPKHESPFIDKSLCSLLNPQF